jgi:hypothetical protein
MREEEKWVRKKNALQLPQSALRQNLLLEDLRDLCVVTHSSNGQPSRVSSGKRVGKEVERRGERTFLIATWSPVSLFLAEQTTPYAPALPAVSRQLLDILVRSSERFERGERFVTPCSCGWREEVGEKEEEEKQTHLVPAP